MACVCVCSFVLAPAAQPADHEHTPVAAAIKTHSFLVMTHKESANGVFVCVRVCSLFFAYTALTS